MKTKINSEAIMALRVIEIRILYPYCFITSFGKIT